MGRSKDSEFADSRANLRRQLAESVDERRQALELGDALGTSDLELAADLAALGFDERCACVVDLLPLVQIAWADGKIQRRERELLEHVLRCRSLKPGDPPYELIVALLEDKPSEAYFEASTQALARLLADRKATASSLLSMAVDVAEASGGLLGLIGLGGSIGAEEREALARLAESLGADAQRELAERLYEGD